jgi:hypothetical protein
MSLARGCKLAASIGIKCGRQLDGGSKVRFRQVKDVYALTYSSGAANTR